MSVFQVLLALAIFGIICLTLVGGAAVLIMLLVSRVDVGARDEVARAHIRATLEPAVQRYQILHGDHPPTLVDCVEDPAIGLPAEALIDPWGNEYQYEPPDGNDPSGKCRIWSNGPRPDDPGGRIGNW